MSAASMGDGLSASPWRPIREWVGIGVGIWIAFAISTGLDELRDLRIQAESSHARVSRIETALQLHSDRANEANLALSRILWIIDARLARLEGEQDGRLAHGRRTE